MFKIKGRTIYLSRGDYAHFIVRFRQGEDYYEFQPGDVMRFTVSKNFKTEKYVLQKEVVIEEETTEVNFFLSPEETKFGRTISVPLEYQYDIVLNDMYSAIGYDTLGPAKLILYPRSNDITD